MAGAGRVRGAARRSRDRPPRHARPRRRRSPHDRGRPVIVLALDTASPSTVTGVLLADGSVVEARDDPAEGSRGEHASRLLVLVEQALAQGGVGWGDVDRIAVGVGPGGFTGLRIGIATARALAQARGLPLVPVGSLAALAAG